MLGPPRSGTGTALRGAPGREGFGKPGRPVGPGDHGEPTVAEWAAWAGTIEHDVVTGIGARVARRIRAVPHLRSLS